MFPPGRVLPIIRKPNTIIVLLFIKIFLSSYKPCLLLVLFKHLPFSAFWNFILEFLSHFLVYSGINS